jgi:hypothetical protein
MSVRVKRVYPALKHGGYAAVGILPGENAAAFEKLHRDLIAELGPIAGPLEKDIYETLACSLWRKKNLRTVRIAELARRRCAQIENEKVSPSFDAPGDFIDNASRQTEARAADEQARKELGDTYELVEIGEASTTDGLLKDLDVRDRLDATIDKNLKRLMHLAGLKLMLGASSSTSPKSLVGAQEPRDEPSALLKTPVGPQEVRDAPSTSPKPLVGAQEPRDEPSALLKTPVGPQEVRDAPSTSPKSLVGAQEPRDEPSASPKTPVGPQEVRDAPSTSPKSLAGAHEPRDAPSASPESLPAAQQLRDAPLASPKAPVGPQRDA